MKSHRVLQSLAVSACLSLGITIGNANITIDLVNVGNAGNPDDSTGYGGVAYEYAIGSYEVTIGQYTSFLNAVAATDVHQLYDTPMGTNLNIAGIARTGVSGNYTYSVIDNAGSSANRPITFVNWLDAARFANWMANGQPTGVQETTTTENGAYALNGAMSGVGFARNLINPNTGLAASWYIPTGDEWSKAAYFDASSGNYYDYPTQTYQGPGDTKGDAPGTTVGNSFNQANYYTGGYFSLIDDPIYNSNENYLTSVGAFSGSQSFYGTFDQGGNVAEWTDSIWSGRYELRGGGWPDNWSHLVAGVVSVNESSTHEAFLGFRLVSVNVVPEPSTAVLIFIVGAGFLGWNIRRSR